MLHIWLRILAVIGTMVFCVIALYIYAWFEARKEVKKIPREPMLLCDIHGFFPARYAVNLDVDGVGTGKMDLCPFCMKERVAKKQVPV